VGQDAWVLERDVLAVLYRGALVIMRAAHLLWFANHERTGFGCYDCGLLSDIADVYAVSYGTEGTLRCASCWARHLEANPGDMSVGGWE
jgi:hypothetical protein